MRSIPKQHFSQDLAYSLISIAIIIYGLWLLQDLLIPLAFSGLFSILLLPMCRFFERLRCPRPIAILFSLIIFVVALCGLLYVAYQQIIGFEEILPELSTKADKLFTEAQTMIRDRFNVGRKTQMIEAQKYLTELLKNNGGTITSIFGSTTSFLANLALVPLYIFLLLLYRSFFRSFFYKVFKTTPKPIIDSALTKIYEVVLSYISGLAIVVVIIGGLNTLGLYIIGIDYAFFFGFFAAFLCILPYIGIFIGAILPILMALITKDSYLSALAVVGLFGVVQFLEGNFITPYVVGSKVSINSLAAMLSLIIFGNLWGVAGLILALPLTAILKVVFDHVERLKPYGFLIGEVN